MNNWSTYTTAKAASVPRRTRSGAYTSRLPLDRVYDNRFEKKAKGRGKGESDVKSHYRKGKAGDWRNHFTDEHIGAFVEQFGDLAEVLGYEPDARWTDNASRSTPKQ